jgi:hypothetical protein
MQGSRHEKRNMLKMNKTGPGHDHDSLCAALSGSVLDPLMCPGVASR